MAGRDGWASLHAPTLPKARQWIEWLDNQRATLPGGDGWVRGLADGVVELHHQIVTAARRLRGNPTWDLQGTMSDDTIPLEEQARRFLTRVEGLSDHDVPVRFKTWLECLKGACRQHVRLAHEIDLLRAGGTLHVDVAMDRQTRRLVEVG